jgi:hypothetical protein
LYFVLFPYLVTGMQWVKSADLTVTYLLHSAPFALSALSVLFTLTSSSRLKSSSLEVTIV